MRYLIKGFLCVLVLIAVLGASPFVRKPMLSAMTIVGGGSPYLYIDKTLALEISIAGNGDASVTPIGVGFTAIGTLAANLFAIKTITAEAVSSAVFVASLTQISTHRYWRLMDIQVAGDKLQISEVQILANSAVEAGATLTSSPVVDSGALADITDGNLSTAPFWNAASIETGSAYLKWDFGVGTARAIDGLKQGGFTDSEDYIGTATLQYSDDDSSWVTQRTVTGIAYPGNNTLSSLISFAP